MTPRCYLFRGRSFGGRLDPQQYSCYTRQGGSHRHCSGWDRTQADWQTAWNLEHGSLAEEIGHTWCQAEKEKGKAVHSFALDAEVPLNTKEAKN